MAIPAGELEAEGREAGFTVRERRWIAETPEWTGSVVVVLEKP